MPAEQTACDTAVERFKSRYDRKAALQGELESVRKAVVVLKRKVDDKVALEADAEAEEAKMEFSVEEDGLLDGIDVAKLSDKELASLKAAAPKYIVLAEDIAGLEEQLSVSRRLKEILQEAAEAAARAKATLRKPPTTINNSKQKGGRAAGITSTATSASATSNGGGGAAAPGLLGATPAVGRPSSLASSSSSSSLLPSPSKKKGPLLAKPLPISSSQQGGGGVLRPPGASKEQQQPPLLPTPTQAGQKKRKAPPPTTTTSTDDGDGAPPPSQESLKVEEEEEEATDMQVEEEREEEEEEKDGASAGGGGSSSSADKKAGGGDDDDDDDDDRIGAEVEEVFHRLRNEPFKEAKAFQMFFNRYILIDKLQRASTEELERNMERMVRLVARCSGNNSSSQDRRSSKDGGRRFIMPQQACHRIIASYKRRMVELILRGDSATKYLLEVPTSRDTEAGTVLAVVVTLILRLCSPDIYTGLFLDLVLDQLAPQVYRLKTAVEGLTANTAAIIPPSQPGHNDDDDDDEDDDDDYAHSDAGSTTSTASTANLGMYFKHGVKEAKAGHAVTLLFTVVCRQAREPDRVRSLLHDLMAMAYGGAAGGGLAAVAPVSAMVRAWPSILRSRRGYMARLVPLILGEAIAKSRTLMQQHFDQEGGAGRGAAYQAKKMYQVAAESAYKEMCRSLGIPHTAMQLALTDDDDKKDDDDHGHHDNKPRKAARQDEDEDGKNKKKKDEKQGKGEEEGKEGGGGGGGEKEQSPPAAVVVVDGSQSMAEELLEVVLHEEEEEEEGEGAVVEAIRALELLAGANHIGWLEELLSKHAAADGDGSGGSSSSLMGERAMRLRAVMARELTGRAATEPAAAGTSTGHHADFARDLTNRLLSATRAAFGSDDDEDGQGGGGGGGSGQVSSCPWVLNAGFWALQGLASMPGQDLGTISSATRGLRRMDESHREIVPHHTLRAVLASELRPHCVVLTKREGTTTTAISSSEQQKVEWWRMQQQAVFHDLSFKFVTPQILRLLCESRWDGEWGGQRDRDHVALWHLYRTKRMSSTLDYPQDCPPELIVVESGAVGHPNTGPDLRNLVRELRDREKDWDMLALSFALPTSSNQRGGAATEGGGGKDEGDAGGKQQNKKMTRGAFAEKAPRGTRVSSRAYILSLSGAVKLLRDWTHNSKKYRTVQDCFNNYCNGSPQPHFTMLVPGEGAEIFHYLHPEEEEGAA